MRFADDTTLLPHHTQGLVEILVETVERVKAARLEYGCTLKLHQLKLMVIDRIYRIELTGCLY